MIERRKVNYIVDADIRKFFDMVDQGWLIRFLEHRIGDKRVIRLITKWLKAGVLVEGQRQDSEVGTPQGAVISPILANIYLHYVLDLWFRRGANHVGARGRYTSSAMRTTSWCVSSTGERQSVFCVNCTSGSRSSG